MQNVKLRLLGTFIFIVAGIPAVSDAEKINVDMDSANAWTVVQDTDASAEFGFDYSIYGIPAAPHGTDTRGIRLAANRVDPAEAAAITVSPKDLTFSEHYRVEVDAWLNYYGDPTNNGTTEFAGVFVGFDPSGDPLNGSGLIGDTDGDTADDYRLVVNGTALPIDSGQYLVESLNNSDPIFADQFPSQDVPSQQFDDFDPPNEEPLPVDGRLAFAWRRFAVTVDHNVALFAIDDLEIGYLESETNDVDFSGAVGVTLWDLFSSVAPNPEFAFTIYDNLSIELFEAPGLAGDFDSNGLLEANDLNLLSAELRANGQDPAFDVDGSGSVDDQDHTYWIKTLRNTWIGDTNLDGEFSSTDFVEVLTLGKYEDGLPLNAGWEEGDWNGDGDFDTSDFVVALTDGGFEIGPQEVVAAVPEPTSFVLVGCVVLLWSVLPRCGRRPRPAGGPTRRTTSEGASTTEYGRETF